MSRTYVNTAAGNDTTALLLKKTDEVITTFNASDTAVLLAKLNVLIDAYDSLKSSHAALVGKYNTLQASYAAVIVKFATEAALVNGPYVDGTASGTDASDAAPAHAAAGTPVPITTAASELYL